MPRARPTLHDPAYAPLEGNDLLPLLSWLCFLGTLMSRQLARLVPRSLRPYPWGVATPIFVATALAVLGVLLALAARRRSSHPRFVRLALAFNGFVLLLSFLAALGAVWILGH